VFKKKSVSSASKNSVFRSKSRRQRPFSSDLIGDVAGDVWQLLTERNGQSLAAIKKSIDAPADVVLAAVGWLAREEKLEFEESRRSVMVSLR
jgi:hypothetical protein